MVAGIRRWQYYTVCRKPSFRARNPYRDYHEVRPYSCRVSDAGNIAMPIVGDILVAGKAVGEIEASIVDAYYPK